MCCQTRLFLCGYASVFGTLPATMPRALALAINLESLGDWLPPPPEGKSPRRAAQKSGLACTNGPGAEAGSAKHELHRRPSLRTKSEDQPKSPPGHINIFLSYEDDWPGPDGLESEATT